MLLIISTLHFLVVMFMSVLGYERFQQLIPNGEIVPHPCKEHFLWRGVGHMNVMGGGPNNPFGLDFKANGERWDSELCKKDSDGDGKTNGEELGDPDCLWTKGKQPARKFGLSHPGICDPFDNLLCNGKPDFVNCDQEEFVCPAAEEQGVFNFTVRIPETAIPSKETTYICYIFEFPSDENHIVAYTPAIDNSHVMHHILVFKCTDETDVTDSPYVCGMTPSRTCSEVITVWSMGLAGVCPHKDSGILVGGERGIKKAAIQLHWNNPEKRANYVDSSGMVFYLTPKLRPFNAGMWMIGQTYLEIPPGQESYTVEGGCPSECSAFIITDEITVVSAVNHMHYMGRSQVTEVWRDGVFIADLATDKQYSYDHPVLHNFEQGVIVKPGDEIRTTCVYKSTSRDTTTYYGDDTTDEMCFSFLSYFPAEKTRRRCNAWRDTSPCDWKDNDNIALGCDFRSLRLDNPEMRHLVSNVTKKCLPGFCKVECLLYVREIKKLPCFVGDADKYARYIALVEKPQNDTFKYISNFYAALDSCDKELMDEQIHALKTAFNMEKKESEVNGSCAINRCDNECGVSSAETVVFGVQVFIFVTMLHHFLFGCPVF